MHDLLVAELMTPQVTTCDPDTPLQDVLKIFLEQRFSCLVVIEENCPVGIITERDMVSLLADQLADICWDAVEVKKFMSTPVITLYDDLKLFETITVLRENNIRHAPVINRQGKLAGILTQTDIVDGVFETFGQNT